MEHKLIVLNVNSNVDELLKKVEALDYEELQHSRKQSIEGGITASVILIVIAKYVLPQLKDILIEYMRNNKIGQIKIGDIEIKNVSQKELIDLIEKTQELSDKISDDDGEEK